MPISKLSRGVGRRAHRFGQRLLAHDDPVLEDRRRVCCVCEKRYTRTLGTFQSPVSVPCASCGALVTDGAIVRQRREVMG